MTAQGSRRRAPGRARTGAGRAVAIIVGVLMAAGLVAGLVWPHLVPQVEMQMTELGPYPVSETEAGELMVMDGWFALLGGGLGLLCGSVLATMFLRYGSAMVFALVGGSCAAALLAFTVGTIGGNGELVLAWNPQATPGTSLTAPLQLHAYGVALLWPIATLAPVVPLAWWAWPYDDEEGEDVDRGAEGVAGPPEPRSEPGS